MLSSSNPAMLLPASNQPDTHPTVECHSDHFVLTLATILAMEMETLATIQVVEETLVVETLVSILDMEMETLFWNLETLASTLVLIVETLRKETQEIKVLIQASILAMEMETATQLCQGEDHVTTFVETTTDVEAMAMGMVMDVADPSAGQDATSSLPVPQVSNGMEAMETVSHVELDHGDTIQDMVDITQASTYHLRMVTWVSTRCRPCPVGVVCQEEDAPTGLLDLLLWPLLPRLKLSLMRLLPETRSRTRQTKLNHTSNAACFIF